MSDSPPHKLCPKCRRIYPATDNVCGRDKTALEASGDIVAERYIKGKRLGAGGMGVVYEAEEPALGRRVALKLIKVDAERWKYFEREGQAMGALEDEHIVRVYNQGYDERHGAFIAMEYLEGETLADHLARHGAVPPPRALRLWRQAVRGMVAAYTKGIVHRDLKPANLFITKRLDETGEAADLVKILDFGVAILELAGEAMVGGRVAPRTRQVGTVGFAAPEQWRSGEASPAADVYSLGVVLLSMLIGQQEVRRPLQVLEKLQAKLPMSPQLHRLCADVLAEEAALRPQNASELLARIRILPEESAWPQGWPQGPLAISMPVPIPDASPPKGTPKQELRAPKNKNSDAKDAFEDDFEDDSSLEEIEDETERISARKLLRSLGASPETGGGSPNASAPTIPADKDSAAGLDDEEDETDRISVRSMQNKMAPEQAPLAGEKTAAKSIQEVAQALVVSEELLTVPLMPALPKPPAPTDDAVPRESDAQPDTLPIVSPPPEPAEKNEATATLRPDPKATMRRPPAATVITRDLSALFHASRQRRYPAGRLQKVWSWLRRKLSD